MSYSDENMVDAGFLQKNKNLRASLTRAGTYISTPEKCENASKTELLGRSGNLTRLYEDFQQLLLHDSREIDEDYIDTFESDYFSIKATYEDRIRSMSSTQSESNALCPNVNFKCDLPLSVPKFEGDPSEFASFFELFSAIVHENATLEPRQKLFVLRSSLGGKALQLIENIKLTSANYSIAYDLVKNYYQNNRFVIFGHIQKFMEAEICLPNDPNTLRSLLTITRSSLRSLEGCGVSTHDWDTLLIYVVLSKVDNKTRELWESQYKTISEIGKIDELFSFLEQRANLLTSLNKSEPVMEIEALTRRPQRQGSNSALKNKQVMNENIPTVRCFRCGRTHKLYSCPAWGKRCNKCGRDNHFSKYCKSKMNEVNVVDSSIVCDESAASISEVTEEFSIKEVGLLHKKCSPWTKVVNVNGQCKIEFKIDTGANASVLPLSYVSRIGSVHIVKTSICVVTYLKERIPVVGTVSLPCESNDTQIVIDFLVVDVNQTPLLGLRDAIAFNLIKRLDVLKHCDLIAEYDDIFNCVGGRFPYIQKILVKDKLIPFIERPRRIPYAIRDKVKIKLDELENKGIVKKIEYSTVVVNPTVIVEKKNGDIRLCLDMRKLNQFIQRENYVVPTLEDIISSLEGKSLFTVLDLKEGYHQIELDEESSDLCTSDTIFGRYKFCRLPFGVTSAPEMFQKQVNRLFGDIPGVCIYFDDILVTGSDEQSHDCTLREVFEQARKYNVKFNKTKVQFKQKSVRYLGHIFSSQGIAVDDQYVEAILKMPEPNNKEEVLRFLGIVKYVSRFIPNLSEISAPLRELTKVDTPWSWSGNEELAVQRIKESLGSAVNLAYFDTKKNVEVHTDASKSGLGACLMQNDRPVLFASRSLSPTEQKYAVIEKEMLAVQFGIKKFHQFVYGKPIIVILSDHKPLVSIFKKELYQLSPRLQRLRLKLIEYNISVTYRPGREMVIPDTLSRAQLKSDLPACDLEFVVHEFMQQFPMSESQKSKFMVAIEKDAEMLELKKYIVHGWPKSKQLSAELRYYYASASQIVELEGLLLFNNRVIVPRELRQEMLKLLHEGHSGLEKSKGRAKQTIIWPRIMIDLENYIKQCEACQKFARRNTKQPMVSHPIPCRPWQKLFADIMTYKSKDYLIVVDAYSFWVEVLYLTSKSVSAVIKKLKGIFSRFGIPELLVSDNVPFAAELMKLFAQKYNFDIITRSPNYPQANSFAERAVGVVKSIFKKVDDQEQDVYLALLEYRNTPLKHLQLSPSQLLMNRIARTRIPICPQQLQPRINTGVEEKLRQKQSIAERYYNRGAKELEDLSEGDDVYIQHPNHEKWSRGKIKKSGTTPRSFVVEDHASGRLVRRNRIQLRKATKPWKENGRVTTDQNVRRNQPRRRKPPNYLNDYI